jgi:hypothetical protein
LFLGIVYIQQVLMNLALPDFDNNVLLLLGLSSGTYASVKALSGPGGDKGKDEPAEEMGGMEEEEFEPAEENRSAPAAPVVPPTTTAPPQNQRTEGPELVY